MHGKSALENQYVKVVLMSYTHSLNEQLWKLAWEKISKQFSSNCYNNWLRGSQTELIVFVSRVLIIFCSRCPLQWGTRQRAWPSKSWYKLAPVSPFLWGFLPYLYLLRPPELGVTTNWIRRLNNFYYLKHAPRLFID